MKFFKSIFFLFLLGCIFITSCQTNVSNGGKLSLIPADASIVYEINGNEIFAKSGLNDPDNYNFLNIVKLLNGDGYKFLESIFKNSKDAGISADKVLVYISKLPDYAVNISILDKQIFENWLKKAEAPEPSDGDEFRYISVSDDINIAWNDDLLVISGNSTHEKLAERFKSQKDGLLATNADFQQFASKNSDLRLWLKYSFFIDFYEKLGILSDLQEKSFFRFDEFVNIITHSYLNFEDGKITGSMSLSPSQEVKKFKEKFPFFKKSLNKEIFKDMPEQSYLAFNLFINVEEYVNFLRQNVDGLTTEIADPIFDKLIENKLEEIAGFIKSPELELITESLEGDMLLSIHGFNSGIITYPLASASFTVNGESAFKNILSLIPQSIYTLQDGYYSISANKTFIPVYFAYKDDRVFVSNDLDAVKVFVDGPKGKTFADNPISAIMADKMMLYVNLDYETYPDNIKMLLQSVMEHNYNIFTSSIEIYESMYFSSDTEYNSEFNLKLKNKNVNSLKQILKNLDKTLSSSWMY
jgi:hypothetical protein